ncbi:MAG: M3 family metallopeptidase [Bacteriovoracaceae bacterium]|nr:M3 family metallopeptidase [Bacteriovoracaceae bacterium]
MFFTKFETPFETIPFPSINEVDYLPALKQSITKAKEEIEAIKNSSERETFYNVIEANQKVDRDMNTVVSSFFNLHYANTNDEMAKIAQELSPMLAEFSNDILLDAELFSKVRKVYDEKDKLNLDPEELRLLEKNYKEFVRNGALLNDSQKDELREIDKKLSKLTITFSENVLKETNGYELFLSEKSELAGLPEDLIEAAADAATEKEMEGKWLFTLHFPSYVPFMTYSENREKREEMYKAYTSRGMKGNEFDNSQNVKDITSLRYERARLLGYKSHADFVLEERMAKTPDQVFDFLKDLLSHSKEAGLRDVKEVSDFSKENGGPEEIKPWDYSFWAEKLKKARYDLDDEILKPYFKVENCLDGIFSLAEKLYDLKFKERKDIPLYHEDVKTFEVKTPDGKHVGVFYTDLYARPSKQNGAWMTSFREQFKEKDKDVRPHVSIVCNFTKPTETRPSLLTFGELTTLFHEFGHALHNLLSDCKYESLSGSNVYWDFVELPSQIHENWASEKECLDTFAVHHETGEKIPSELVEKIVKSKTFQEGRATLRQIGFALLDMAWHSGDPRNVDSVQNFEREATAETEVLPRVEGSGMTCAFGHIFSGGYSAGYYSYKWAEVLDADAFSAFKEKGIFNKEVATLFKDNILSKGGSEDPMVLYKKFRGKEPDSKALLERAGLV